MSENSTLRIHTQLLPEPSPDAGGGRPGRSARGPRPGKRPRMPARRLNAGDRLLRNSAIACAILLGILALGNLPHPWARRMSEGIEQALTMRIDLDDPIGELTFVRRWMPQSALVFLNVSGSPEMSLPTDGAVTHPWSSLQPWLLFDAGSRPVCAVNSGTVTAVSPLSGGRFGLLIDHGEGLESVCANLEEVSVAAGDVVSRGQQLGTSGDGLYFELRQAGEAIDPTERLGL